MVSHHKFVTRHKSSLCFTEYGFRVFHLENFAIRQIFFHQCTCVHAMNSPNFPIAKVSLHTVELKVSDARTYRYSNNGDFGDILITNIKLINNQSNVICFPSY